MKGNKNIPERHVKKTLEQHVFLPNDKRDKRTPKKLTHDLIEQHELKTGKLRNELTDLEKELEINNFRSKDEAKQGDKWKL